MKVLLTLTMLAACAAAAETPVVVNNSEKNPVPVRAQGPAEPFAFSTQIINPGGSGLVEFPLFTVPAGKRLIIETISARTRSVAPFDLKLRYLAPQMQAFTIPMALWPVQSPLASEGLILSGLHSVRLYVPAGQAVRLQMIGGMAVPGPTNQTFVDIGISGHLVDEF